MADGHEEALRSALGRLPVAVVVLNERQDLRPLNDRAAELFRQEGLSGDLLRARPSHPLSAFVQGIVSGPATDAASTVVAFPSGRQYSIEPSRRSEKEGGRWLVLLIEPAGAASKRSEAFDRWQLTAREREVVDLLLRGLANDDIAREMGVSRETVKSHVGRILEKSGFRSRAELIAVVLGKGGE